MEMRRLVRLLNAFPGITTASCCVGHTDTAEAEVDFFAASEADLLRLLTSLPLVGWRAGFENNQGRSQVAWVTVSPLSPRTIYKLRLGGQPRHARLELLSEVEDALRRALTPQPKHRLYPTCASDCSEDMAPQCYSTSTSFRTSACPCPPRSQAACPCPGSGSSRLPWRLLVRIVATVAHCQAASGRARARLSACVNRASMTRSA